MRKVAFVVLLLALVVSAHAQWRVKVNRIPQEFVAVRPAKQPGTPPLNAQGLAPQQTALIYDNYPNDDPAPHLFYYDPTGNGEKAGQSWWVDYDNVGAGGEVRSFEFTAEVTQSNVPIRVYFFRNVTPAQPPSQGNLIPLKNSTGSAVFEVTARYSGYYTFTVTLPSSLYFDVSGNIGWSVVKPASSTGLYFVTWDFNAPIGRRDAYLSIDGGSTWQLTEFYGHPVANFTIRLIGVPVRASAPLFGNVGLQDFGFAVQPPKDVSEDENDAFLPTLEVELRQPGTANVLQTFYTTPYATEQPDGSHAYSYLLPVVPEGTYDIAFRANHWLRKLVPNVTISSVAMVDVDLLNADIDGDNEVTLFDFGALVASFGSLAGDPNWSFNADLDGDLEVTLFDFGILVRNFGLIGDE